MQGMIKSFGNFLKSKKTKLALLSRILLVSTFIDDGTRMLWFDSHLVEYASENTVGVTDSYFGYLMFLLNAIFSIGGSITLLAGKRPQLGCFILAAATVTQILITLFGYKTQLAAITFIVLTFLHAFINYDFWLYFGTWDYENKKFLFFQSLSAIGGIMQILVYGAGEISVDAILKKD
ncbi:Oidioi.mRNA.OKI2018_I69.chr1.g1204.t1.cds [Oikopleura dioica]|uniref:Oidioi.mRNA.OKI2018_I69.chr1.g1204.t1.cds n=1 Tax=Oikopleura dioica TaxID=34765 RepID=A0ABN7STJ5_OIKDI|nr:Oidioi.mRNA.OKI2018_I69.chr1.g1204.t1.cds [Oikopleura dioica]